MREFDVVVQGAVKDYHTTMAETPDEAAKQFAGAGELVPFGKFGTQWFYEDREPQSKRPMAMIAVTERGADERIKELVLHSVGLLDSLENDLRQLQDLIPDYGMALRGMDITKARDDISEVLLIVGGIQYEDED